MLAMIQKILAWRFFSRRKETTGIFAIIAWWELRRIPYNLIVGAAGIPILFIIASDPPDPPIFVGVWMIMYAIGANVCFTGGWIVEIAVRKIWGEQAGAFGQISFVLGLVFSVLLTLAPAALIAAWLVLRMLLR